MSNCPTCDNNFDADRAMKIHHKSAHGESIAKEETICEECNNRFEYYPSNKNGIYCSDCVDSGVNHSIENMGDNISWGLCKEDNPNYRGGDFIECGVCDEETWFSPSTIENRNNFFCSEKCYRSWQSDTYQGEGNPFWKGGYNPNYSDGWWSARREARDRDDHKCQVCGAEKSSDGRECDVHHKKPVREFEEPSDAHFLENLITLCKSCHVSVENGYRKI